MKQKKGHQEKIVKTLNRRDFIKTASLAATAAAAAPALFGPFSIITRQAHAQPGQTDQIKVIVARDEGVAQGSTIITDYVQVVMDEAIRQLTGIFNVGSAYKSIFPGINSDSVIGIKVNCINPYLPTHPEVVDTLVNGLLQMDFSGTPFSANNIIIWDRQNSELAAVGYTINTGTEGVRCFGTDQVGYNSSVSLDCNGTTQHPSRILTDYIDYHIDFAVLKNAGGCGLTMALKNNYGCIDAPWNLHDNNCDPGIPSVNAAIRDELDVVEALFVVDSIFGSYTGGPTGPPNMEYHGVLMSFDRVAVDTIGREILEENGCTTTGLATHIDTAAQEPYNLGTNDLDEIHRIDIENPSEAVEGLRVIPEERHIKLSWESGDNYTGFYKVLRSAEPSFESAEEIGVTRFPYFVDARVMGNNIKSFYRIQKTW